MNWDEYEKWVKHLGEWGAEYHKTLRNRPVRAQTKPGDIAQQLEESAPETGTDMTEIMSDFERIVMPGMTHWQHPRFFAYFPQTPAHHPCWRISSHQRWLRSACCGKPHLRQPKWKPGSLIGCVRQLVCQMNFRA